MSRMSYYFRFLLTTAWVLALPVLSLAQLSPGELAEPHADLEGVANCTKCHELGEGPSAARCLECHRNIRSRLESAEGFHYQVVTVEGAVCFDCHSDHAGREFELIHWPEGIENFDHDAVGFNLQGKHRTLACRDCHHPGLIRDPLSDVEPGIDLTRTYLGLGTDCLSCHGDEHRGQLGDDCLRCHDNNQFKPAVLFAHERTRFRLTGKHQSVSCEKCHQRVADTLSAGVPQATFVKYTGLQFANCGSCHKDAHEGRFGADCARCHQTTGWKASMTNDFDHSRTAFPLTGQHAKVACERCHKTGSLLDAIAHENCTDCHRDHHRGQFADRPDRGGCESCHTTNGFLPARFGVKDHADTQFPLRGAHMAQPCLVCHTMVEDADTSAYRQYTITDRACTGCHIDVHRGQFSATEPVKQCTACHSEDTWKEPAFDHNRDSAYPLTGAHLKVPCRECHPSQEMDGESFVTYRGLSKRCENCHQTGSNLKELDS